MTVMSIITPATRASRLTNINVRSIGADLPSRRFENLREGRQRLDTPRQVVASNVRRVVEASHSRLRPPGI